MFVLNIELSERSGSEPLLSQTFKTVFVPAISKQEGFASAALWRPEIANAEYRPVIEFENQALQPKWLLRRYAKKYGRKLKVIALTTFYIPIPRFRRGTSTAIDQ